MCDTMSTTIRVEFPSGVEPDDSDGRGLAAQEAFLVAMRRNLTLGPIAYQSPLRGAIFLIKDVSREEVASLLDEAQAAACEYAPCEVVAVDNP